MILQCGLGFPGCNCTLCNVYEVHWDGSKGFPKVGLEPPGGLTDYLGRLVLSQGPQIRPGTSWGTRSPGVVAGRALSPAGP